MYRNLVLLVFVSSFWASGDVVEHSVLLLAVTVAGRCMGKESSAHVALCREVLRCYVLCRALLYCEVMPCAVLYRVLLFCVCVLLICTCISAGAARLLARNHRRLFVSRATCFAVWATSTSVLFQQKMPIPAVDANRE